MVEASPSGRDVVEDMTTLDSHGVKDLGDLSLAVATLLEVLDGLASLAEVAVGAKHEDQAGRSHDYQGRLQDSESVRPLQPGEQDRDGDGGYECAADLVLDVMALLVEGLPGEE